MWVRRSRRIRSTLAAAPGILKRALLTKQATLCRTLSRLCRKSPNWEQRHGITVWTLLLVGPYKQQTPPRNYFFLVVRAAHVAPAFMGHTDPICLNIIRMFFNLARSMGKSRCAMTESSVDGPSVWSATIPPRFRLCSLVTVMIGPHL